jgi:hypothetical protein
MDKVQFAECFFPIAKFKWHDEDTMKTFAATYYDTMKIFPVDIVTEICHQITETVDLFKNFPSPAEMKMKCWMLREERSQYKFDSRIGNRPQDIAARAKFYDTVRNLVAKHGNRAPEGFTTPLFSVYQNCVRELKMMDTYHELHGEKEPIEVEVSDGEAKG